MGAWQSYRMRLRRKRAKIRAFRKHFSLNPVINRTDRIKPGDVLLFSTMRDEHIRLPYFLRYYREQGKYGHGHWTLVVDPDEFFIYPFCDTRPIRALTDWLDTSQVKSFGAMLLDMYPKGRIDAVPYQPGQNPIEIAAWFDPGNYIIEKNKFYGNLWIQGGPRARVFFPDNPKKAPALNKTPLVRWDRRYAYESSTHMILPRGLNLTYDEWGGEKASGILLHAKFLDTFTVKAAEELTRRQHYSGSVEYKAYAELVKDNPELWCKWSEKYINWRQLEILGLMSKGNWA